MNVVASTRPFVCHRCLGQWPRTTLPAPSSFTWPSQNRSIRTRTVKPRTAGSTRRPRSGNQDSKSVYRNETAESNTSDGSSPSIRNIRSRRLLKIEKHPQAKFQSEPEPKTFVELPPKHYNHNPPPGQLGDFNYYWDTFPPTIAQKAKAKQFFTKGKQRAEFLRSVAHFRQFPEGDVPEVAFVGRSNVGKSSLLNAVVNSGKNEIFARTSSTPGFTRTMNLYGIGGIDPVRIKRGQSGGHDKIVGIGGLLIVDLPGYGEGSLSGWGLEIMKYFTKRKQLRRVFVLIDAAHGLKESDRNLLSTLRLAGVSHQVVLSKLDRIYIPEAKKVERISKGSITRNIKPRGSIAEIGEKLAALRHEIKPPNVPGALGELVGVSSEILVNGDRLGMDNLRVSILQAAGFSFDNNSLRKAHSRQ